MNWKATLLTSLVILAVAAGMLLLIFSTEPKATRVSATKRTAMLVDVAPVESGTFTPVIEAMGNVRAENEIVLSPQVNGQIVSISPSFTPGAFVKKGDLLVEIDKADYETVLLQRKSELHQAMANLELEKGRQRIAEQDYALLGDQVVGENRSLVLREPQLNSAIANVESAEAAIKQAELDLRRTEIRAPFNAHILDRQVNIGSLVSRGQTLGTIIGIDRYWIEATLPVSKLDWIDFPNGKDGGAEVLIRSQSAWPTGSYREGIVSRFIGALEPQTRMARVLITVEDPLSRKSGNTGKPRLIVGSYVEVEIKGRPLENVIRLNRDYLRANDTVWIKKDGKLEIRKLEIIFSDREFAYIGSGLSNGDYVVTSNLSTVTEGASLRLEGETQ